MDYTAVGQPTDLVARMGPFASPGTILLTTATLKPVVVLGSVGAGGHSSCSKRGPHGGDGGLKPNTLDIVADNLGWKDVGFRGSDIGTPHIGPLARTGARLDQVCAQPMAFSWHGMHGGVSCSLSLKNYSHQISIIFALSDPHEKRQEAFTFIWECSAFISRRFRQVAAELARAHLWCVRIPSVCQHAPSRVCTG